MRQGGLGHHQEAAGVLVQAVHQTRAAHFADLVSSGQWCSRAFEQGAAPVPGAGWTTSPGGLLTTRRSRSSKTMLEGEGFRGETAGRRRRHRDQHRVAGPHPVGGGPELPVDRDQPGLEEFLQPGPGPVKTRASNWSRRAPASGAPR